MSAADYVVVGGGIYGCAIAWELARSGAEVTLLERGTIASGSSGGSGARGVRSDGRDVREAPAARRAQELWPTLDEALGATTGYARIGGLRLFEWDHLAVRGGRSTLEARAWMQNQRGIRTQILERNEILELEPGISERVTHALYVEHDGIAPHEQTTRAFANAATASGATLREHAPANALVWNGNHVVGVDTDEYRVDARRGVIIAANAASEDLLGERRPVPGWSVVPQATFIKPRRPHNLTHLVNHESRPLSLKAGPDGSIQVSGGARGRWDADTGRVVPDETVIPTVLAHAAAVYPDFESAQVIGSEAGGPESCSPDGIPVVDLVPGTPNLFVAGLWTAHGFALAPAIAEALSAWALGGSRPEVLAPFAADRFGPRVI